MDETKNTVAILQGESIDRGTKAEEVIATLPALGKPLDEETKGLGYVAISWVGVIDNGEGGVGKPHGPYGSLHIDVFAGDKKLKPIGRSDGLLVGPHKTNGHPGEWLDGDAKRFKPDFKLYNWKKENEQIGLKIWESDPGPTRDHDVLTYLVISRPKPKYLNKHFFYFNAHKRYYSADDALATSISRRKQFKKGNWFDWMEKNTSGALLRHPPKIYVQLITFA